MNTFPEYAVLKTVPLKFNGVELKLKTSHALFSSHHVDDGTMLLLKTLAQRSLLPTEGKVLDAGCGTGPLALAIKKYRPALEVTARDRLALAAAFTAENARLNGLKVDAGAGLLLDETPGPWNLIVSNLPAKAGEPVLDDFVARSLTLLAPGGWVAVVIVEPLAAWLIACLDRKGALVRYQESGGGYRVFHYQASSAPSTDLPASPFPQVYARGSFSWTVARRALSLQTFFGLPNFDAVDFRLQVTEKLLEGLSLKGDGLVWESGQGHLAAWADAHLPASAVLHLAGNDALGLKASAANVRRRPSLYAVPALSDVECGAGSLGWAVVCLHPEPEVPWVDATLDALRRLLAPGAVAVINGTSTDLTRLLERHKGLRKRDDLRMKGWRAVVLERQTAP